MAHNPEFDVPEENVHTFSLVMHAEGVVGQGTAQDPPEVAESPADNEKEN